MCNYSHTAVSIMKLVMEEGWWSRWRWIPLSGAPNGLQICPPKEEYDLAAAPYRKTWWILLSDFFLPESKYIELDLRSEELQGGHEVGGAPLPSWTGRGPPDVDLPSNIFYIFQNNSPLIFRSFWELLYLHKNNTMAILLKIASVRVSSIQIVQVRVQNKGKSVWKSRYDGDVTTPLKPLLVLKQFSWKLKVIKKNFYKLCLILLL